MTTMSSSVKEFLAQKRLAVAGVTRHEANAPGNLIFRKLRDAGYDVCAINPKAEQVEGTRCYPDLKSAPGPLEGVVLATPPAATEALVRECAELGIGRVWMHRSLGRGSMSEAAVAFCRGKGIEVIAGGCPMMFCEPVDFGHKCLRWMLGVTGKLPT